ncbi:amidase domain-containing protein [Listeria booriae]|uniref:Amidase domain-containing protein n=1 Tax=Listeria booriae TaxID=1552123 RepID=A0A842AUM7_9LIST|nr:DNRLRE domain-containing protein [Listeria booriae]MBC1795344.1 amidase domain-containing protein [Listeria booriae]
MKKWLSRVFAVSLVMMLVFSSVPIMNPQAGDTTDSTTVIAEVPGKKAIEIVEERTDTEMVYDNQDGTFTKQIYTEPVNVKEDGDWEPISNTMVFDGSDNIASERTEIQPTFFAEMEQGRYSKFGDDEDQITFSLESAEGEQGKEAVRDVSATLTGNEVRYKDILKSTDLRNLTFNTSVKEDIVLREYTGIHSYNFNVTTALKAEKLADGSIVFKDGAGTVEYTLPKPVMTDSNIHPATGNATESDAVSFELKNISADIYQITLTADQSWLKDDARVYPVYIDPSVQLKKVVDAGISSVTPTANYSGSKLWDAALNEYVLKVGRYDDTTGFNYAYIKPDTSSLANATIESATFKAYAVWHHSSTAKNPVKLEEVTGDWTTTGVTWNTRPTTFNVGSVDIGRNQWASFDVTSSVRAWTKGIRPNKGFMMHTVNQQDHWKKFTATETGKNVPYLEVTYTYDKPEKATIKTVSNGVGTGTGYMNVSWDKMPGAIGYKVIIGNGYNYEQIAVGNVTSWTTKGKNIFPTKTEIASGLYKFHTDGKGTEFASDPRALYENGYKAGSTFGLRNQTKYIVRILAIYPGGDGPTSDITDAYMPPEVLPAKPEKSVIKTTSNGAGTGTGYMDISWSAVPDAIDYKVVIGNGYNYEYFNTGNVTNWSTKGKNIFPTQEEIDEGKYKFHKDGMGEEFANNPRDLYENGFIAGSTFGLRNQEKYIVRILPVYNWGDGVSSDITDAYMPLETPAAPMGQAYANAIGTDSGYVILDWDDIEGADGYKVTIFDGKKNVYFDVGSETSWTTKGKGIWPTKQEITKGDWSIHTDGYGAELAIDPSQVYKNSGGVYGERKNYWFRVQAYTNKGKRMDSINSDPFTPVIPKDQELSELSTIGEIEFFLMDYLKMQGKDMAVNSGEFKDFVIKQLMDDEDVSLSLRDDYSIICSYLSEYLHAETTRDYKIEPIEGTQEVFDTPMDLEDTPMGNESIPEPSEKLEIIEIPKKDPDTVSPLLGEQNTAINDMNEIAKAEEIENNLLEEANVGLLKASAYNPSKAVKYAKKWAYGRNSNYRSFSDRDGDCTNFVSQAIYNGGMSERVIRPVPYGIKKTTSYWYSQIVYTKVYSQRSYVYYKTINPSTSWVNVSDFAAYWSKYQPVKTYTSVDSAISYAREGDIIQFKKKGGSRYFHSMIVVEKSGGTLYLAGHTDSYDRRNIKTSMNGLKGGSIRVIKFNR